MRHAALCPALLYITRGLSGSIMAPQLSHVERNTHTHTHTHTQISCAGVVPAGDRVQTNIHPSLPRSLPPHPFIQPAIPSLALSHHPSIHPSIHPASQPASLLPSLPASLPPSLLYPSVAYHIYLHTTHLHTYLHLT